MPSFQHSTTPTLHNQDRFLSQIGSPSCAAPKLQGDCRMGAGADDQHVLALDIGAHVHDESNGTGGLAAAFITRHGDKLDRPGNRHAARQIGEEDEGSLEDANEDDITAVGVVFGNLCSEFRNALLDFLFANQYNWEAHGEPE